MEEFQIQSFNSRCFALIRDYIANVLHQGIDNNTIEAAASRQCLYAIANIGQILMLGSYSAIKITSR